MPCYSLFWLDGSRASVEGETIGDAMKAAGIGAGALKALDFWSDDDNISYRWDNELHTWILDK